MSTVHNAETKDTIVADVVSRFRHPKFEGKVVIVVEGEDDIRLYSSLFNGQFADFYNLKTKGCSYFEDVLQECNPNYGNRFFVIKDADFDHLNGRTYSYPNLFLTDTHDAETMMMTDEGLKSICCENLLDKDAIQVLDIMEDLKVYSYLKWFNETHQIGINFDALSIFSLYRGNSIDIDSCINYVYSVAANKDKPIVSSKLLSSFLEDKNDTDLFQLSNGHDICDGIRVKIGLLKNNKHAVGKGEIPKCLRIKYSLSDFEQTQLHLQIVSWANKLGYNLF